MITDLARHVDESYVCFGKGKGIVSGELDAGEELVFSALKRVIEPLFYYFG